MNNIENYHGIVVSFSQKNKSIFQRLHIIGLKKVLFGIIKLYKIDISEKEIKKIIQEIQMNMSKNIFMINQEFYAHFYRKNELIIVYRNKIFSVTLDKNSWEEAIEYGKSIGIKENQLDFIPNRFEEEQF